MKSVERSVVTAVVLALVVIRSDGFDEFDEFNAVIR